MSTPRHVWIVVAMGVMVVATVMPQSILTNVLRYAAMGAITVNLALTALRGYRRRRPHWTARSWRRYVATCAIPVGAFVLLAGMLIALDLRLPMIGEPRSPTRAFFAVTATVFLLVGAIGLVIVIRWLADGDPSQQFTGPRWLFGRSTRR